LKLGSRSSLDIELPAAIVSDGGPFWSFSGYRKSRTDKVADRSLRRPVSQARLAEYSLMGPLSESAKNRSFAGGHKIPILRSFDRKTGMRFVDL
jgi:hypothetical protein